MLEVRAAAAKTIAAVAQGGHSLGAALATYQIQVIPRERPLLQELCFGTLRSFHRQKAIVNALLDKPLKAKDADVLALLACALHQLTDTRIPSHAAVNQSVAACTALGKPWAKRVVNAVLRRFERERSTVETALVDNPEFRSAHPAWLWQTLHTAWPVQADTIIAGNNARPPMTLRVNLAKTTRARYLDDLRAAGMTATGTAHSPAGVQLVQPVPVEQLPGWTQGQVSIQDEAAQLSCELLDLAAGQRVLDACCAPGGKTCHMLEREPGLAELVALDVDPRRLDRVRENLQRLQLNATLLAADATAPHWWDGVPFQRILVDAPCSATGVIRRHPDIKLLRQPADIANLATTQLRLLRQLWPLLAPGGKLLYATCSVLPQENDDVVQQFLDGTPGARAMTPNPSWGIATGHGRQILPGVDACDGFYYALLSKSSGTTALPDGVAL